MEKLNLIFDVLPTIRVDFVFVITICQASPLLWVYDKTHGV